MFFLIVEFSNTFNRVNLRNPADPSHLQISSQLGARGAGGRGGAFRFAPTPQGSWACRSVSSGSHAGTPAPGAGPYPKVPQTQVQM